MWSCFYIRKADVHFNLDSLHLLTKHFCAVVVVTIANTRAVISQQKYFPFDNISFAQLILERYIEMFFAT